jgi:hypothetical protein
MGIAELRAYYRAGGKGRLYKLRVPVEVLVANKKMERCYLLLVDTIYITSEEGEITVENVPVYIVDGDWGEVLIGFPVLEALEATPEQNLAKHYGQTVTLNIDQDLSLVEPDVVLNHPADDFPKKVARRVEALVSAYHVGRINSEQAEKLIDHI